VLVQSNCTFATTAGKRREKLELEKTQNLAPKLPITAKIIIKTFNK